MSDIYKVLTENEWNEACLKGYIDTPLDQEDGFIHFSSARQLALTLQLYFKNEENLVLLQIDTSKLNEEIIFEEVNSKNRKGKFPHLYGKLSVNDVLDRWNIGRGAFKLPNDILATAEKNI